MVILKYTVLDDYEANDEYINITSLNETEIEARIAEVKERYKELSGRPFGMRYTCRSFVVSKIDTALELIQFVGFKKAIKLDSSIEKLLSVEL